MRRAPFTTLETQRLTLRRFRDDDLASFLVYLNDPLVARYQSWESYTEQQASDVIEEQKNLEPCAPGRWFTFAVELKETRQLIGHVALKTAEDARQAEIGFTFARAQHGQGMAFEAAARVLQYLFEDLELHRVTAITDCENVKSAALLERLGMRREGHFVENVWFKGAWGSEYQYAVLRSERVSQTNSDPR